jgi:2-polyprenyl-6-methoxyphenol hydroxylase-like FAD-dependent oxidoreductase
LTQTWHGTIRRTYRSHRDHSFPLLNIPSYGSRVIDRALIFGAGIGGLAAAAALGQRWVDVDVVEIQETNTVYGVGINQPANALRMLKKLGVLDEIVAHGFIYDRVRFCDYNGNLFAEIPHAANSVDVPPNCALPRRELSRILLNAAVQAGADIRFGHTAHATQTSAESVEVQFHDGTTAAYPLVVGFDGIRSSSRRQIFGTEFEPISTGYGAWRVTVERPVEVTCPYVFQSCGTKAGFIPLTADTMYLIGVTPAPTGQHYPKEELVPRLVEILEGYGGIIGSVRDSLVETDNVVYGVMEQVFLPLPWHVGRIVVAGDAAHACAPHLTQGAAMALEDAVVLAESLESHENVDEALEAFETRRYPRAKFTQDASLAILAGESLVTDAETLGVHAKFCAEALPAQIAEVDQFLNQPA